MSDTKSKEWFFSKLETFLFVTRFEKALAERIIQAVQDDDGRFESAKICSAFVFAACLGHTEVVKLFVKCNKELVDMNDSQGDTALRAASRSARTELVDFLLVSGADVNKVDNDGATPLYWAAFTGDEESVSLLIDAGADVDKADKDGETPIWSAAHNGHGEIVAQLIAAGADVNKTDNNERPPIYWAACNDDEKVVTQLIAAGAEITPEIIAHAPINQNILLLLKKAMQERECERFLEVALSLKPLDLPVRVVFEIYKMSPRYFKHTVTRHHAWKVLREIKQR